MDTPVLLALAIISFMLLCALMVVWIVCWSIHTVRDNARLAALYRAQAQVAQPTGPSYTMVYKSNRKQEAIRIMASTEQEALALAHKNNIRYDVIVSLTKD